MNKCCVFLTNFRFHVALLLTLQIWRGQLEIQQMKRELSGQISGRSNLEPICENVAKPGSQWILDTLSIANTSKLRSRTIEAHENANFAKRDPEGEDNYVALPTR